MSSELDAFSTVSRAIDGFPSESDVPEPIEKFLAGATGHPVLSSTRIDHSGAGAPSRKATRPKTVESCRAEILRLEEEIAELEDSLYQTEYKLLEVPISTMDELEEFHGINRKVPEALTDDIDLIKKLQLQEAVEGICFNDVISRVLVQTEERTLRVQTIEGSCCDLDFRVKFEVDETEVTEKSSVPALADQEHRAQITKLEISVDDPWVKEDLESYIESMAGTCSLQPFFRGFQQYARKFQVRKKTYEYFLKTYPACVKLYVNNDQSILQFSHPIEKGIVYTVTWTFQIMHNFVIEENHSLDVFANEEMQGLDRQNILQKAPEQFQKMVKARGIEKTIDTIIQAVSSN